MALGLGLSVPSCTHLKGPLCKYPFLGAVGVWMANLCSHSLGARPPADGVVGCQELQEAPQPRLLSLPLGAAAT